MPEKYVTLPFTTKCVPRAETKGEAFFAAGAKPGLGAAAAPGIVCMASRLCVLDADVGSGAGWPASATTWPKAGSA